jgi:hypothetical protein
VKSFARITGARRDLPSGGHEHVHEAQSLRDGRVIARLAVACDRADGESHEPAGGAEAVRSVREEAERLGYLLAIG